MLLGLICFLFLDSVVGESLSNILICEGEDKTDHGGSKDPVGVLRRKYGNNCHHVRYNLIIRDVPSNADLSFLNSIVEVYGSVIIKNNHVNDITLRNLKVIRGEKLYHLYNASLLILNNIPTSAGIVDLRSLRSISKGNVKVKGNRQFCYLNSVNWNSLLEHPLTQDVSKDDLCKGECSDKCSDRNGKSSCWGPGEEMCQRSNTCEYYRRCYFKDGKETQCDKECIGGCTGSSNAECVACKSYVSDNKCVRGCPTPMTRDKVKQTYKSNPNFRYEHGFFCVKQCPETFYSLYEPKYNINKAECLSQCPKDYRNEKKTCVLCSDKDCSTTNCRIDELCRNLTKLAKRRSGDKCRLSRGLLVKLKHCTHLTGALIMDAVSTIKGNYFGKNQDVRVEDLRYLSNLRHINGEVRLMFDALPSVRNLSFLSNLESVTTNHDSSFSILNGKNIDHLGLKSLKTLTVKEFIISRLENLCYMENFKNRFRGSSAKIVLRMIARVASCKEKNMTCDSECDPETGCWGPGPDLCFKCKHFTAGSKCVDSCNSTIGFYEIKGKTTCGKCHKECKFLCSGPGNDQCIGGCKNAENEGKCYATCPVMKFKDENGICRNCSSVCSYKHGSRVCSGPASVYGEGGCRHCELVKLSQNESYRECLSNKQGYFVLENVPSGYRVKEGANSPIFLSPCHKFCKSCIRKATQCSSCKPGYYFFEDHCLDKCGENSYNASVNTTELKCVRCHGECRGCYGPSQHECKSCRITKIYTDKDRMRFYCNSSCPQHSPYKVPENDDYVCEKRDPFASYTVLAVAVPIGILIIMIPMLAYNCHNRRQMKLKRQAEMLHVKYTRRHFNEAIVETDGNADSSHLRIIGINQLQMMNTIGAGAYGTVYRGIWKPPESTDGQQMKITVAIKVLKDQTNKRTTDEFLSEARVMASVDFQNCMHLLGVCCSSKLMLITEFMPTGNLQNYVMNNARELGNRRMLRWSLEIAEGMKYLGSKGIVHRDLAARNVLLDNHDSIRITDFGLAKLNAIDKEFQDTKSRLPIRWLALECIRYQIFSTKSDVWAYGVTLWEIFSYGTAPYADIAAAGIYHHLVCGERLPQPGICTLDLYMVLLKCWLNDPDSRPTFDELIKEIEQMSGDPGRYLIIETNMQRRHTSGSCSNKTLSSSSSHELKALSEGQKHPRYKNMQFPKLQQLGSLDEDDDVFEDPKSIQGAKPKRDYVNVQISEPIRHPNVKYVNVPTNMDVHNIGYENPINETAVCLQNNSPQTSLSTNDDYLIPDVHRNQNSYDVME